MKVTVEKLDAQPLATITLEIPGEYALQEYNKTCRRISQRINVPGFRRGKVPRNMVEKTVGVERIKQEALDRLLPHAFSDAISEHQLDIVATPQVESYEFDLTTGIQVKARVELRPEVTLPSLESIQVEAEIFKPADDAIEQELQAVLSRMTTLEPVINRAAGSADIVNIDFSGSVNGEAIRGGAAKNFRLDLGENNFIDGFAAQVVGHNLGEEFSIDVTFPADYTDAALAGKPAQFLIKINEIKQKVVPELNDALAKKIAGVETVTALHETMQKSLTEHTEHENTMRRQKAVVDWVVAHSEVIIPEGMIERETQFLMQDLQQRFKSAGVSWEQYTAQQGADTVMANMRQDAHGRVKASLVFGAIAKAQEFKVSEEEFMTHLRALAEGRGSDEKNMMRYLANHPEALHAINDQVIAQKVLEWLVDKAEVTMVEAKEESLLNPARPPQAAVSVTPEALPDAGSLHEADLEVLTEE